MLWTTFRIYVRRKARRHRWAIAGATVALAVLAGSGAAYVSLGGELRLRPAAVGSRVEAATAAAPLTGETTADRALAPPMLPYGRPQVLPRPQKRPAAAVNAAAARKAAAAKLIRNRRLALTAVARTRLTAGRVDPRVVAAVAALLPAHRLAVTSFTGPPGQLHRSVIIDRVDGSPVSTRDGRTSDTLRRFRKLAGSLRPASAVVRTASGKAVIVVTYR